MERQKAFFYEQKKLFYGQKQFLSIEKSSHNTQKQWQSIIKLNDYRT
jgi:hypothetical protein